MNDRIEYQMRRAQRVLSVLRHRNVPVYNVHLSANHVRPVIETGAGPFAWHCAAFGLDDRGHWADFIAHLDGVELHRRVRSREEIRHVG